MRQLRYTEIKVVSGGMKKQQIGPTPPRSQPQIGPPSPYMTQQMQARETVKRLNEGHGMPHGDHPHTHEEHHGTPGMGGFTIVPGK